VQPRDNSRVNAQRIGHPEAQRKNKRVRQLLDLGPNLPVTPQHGYLIL
jgi:hypothetical protein